MYYMRFFSITEVKKLKVEKISSNKFRITFTDEDLKDFDVDFENIKYGSEDAQEIFWQLIEQADIEDEFFDEGGQIIVEAVASKNKGLTMTVTRVNEFDKTTPKIRRKRERRTKNNDLSPLIYSFADFENLVQACKRIENFFVGISKLYKMDGEYFLVMEAVYENIAASTDSMLSEYGEKFINSSIFEGHLSEYGNLLMQDTAISNISANF